MNATTPAASTTSNDERTQVADALTALARWASSAARQPLPAEVLAKAALVLVDNLAAMSASHSQPEIAALHAMAMNKGKEGGAANQGVGEAVLFRPGAPRAERHTAATANGMAGCWCELDEGFRGAACHAGLYVLPALLAESESRGATLTQILSMLAVGYEIASRVAETWTFASMTVHPHAAFANFGAAAGAGLARDVPADILAAAIRLVGGLVPAGAYQAAVEGALVRNVWSGHAASTGMSAVSWALAGLDGYDDGPHPAFKHLLNATTRVEKLTENLGSRWAITAGYHKLHGCCHSTHTAAEAALQMRQKLDPAQFGDIRAIELFTHRPTMSNTAPRNSLAARFSFEHVVAVGLGLGHTRPQAFDRGAIDDPTVARLRQLIRLSLYQPLAAWPLDRPARLVVTLAGGRVLQTECLSAPGGPDQPLSPERLLQKAVDLTAADYPRFGGIARAIVELQAATLQSPWRDLASGMLGGQP